MKAKPDHENETVSEREQSSIDPPADTAPNLEQVKGAADKTRAADGIDDDVEPVEVAQD